MRSAAPIEIVREERVELDAEQASLREKRAALFHNGEEMRHRSRLREDDRLADERAALRPADVEHIRQPRDIRERHIVRAAAERVRQARAVKEERHAVCAADFADGG